MLLCRPFVHLTEVKFKPRFSFMNRAGFVREPHGFVSFLPRALHAFCPCGSRVPMYIWPQAVLYPLRKNLSFSKHLKITQKFTQNCQIVDNVLSIGIWRRLKRDRDIGRKAVLSDVKRAFTLTPALNIHCVTTQKHLFKPDACWDHFYHSILPLL